MQYPRYHGAQTGSGCAAQEPGARARAVRPRLPDRSIQPALHGRDFGARAAASRTEAACFGDGHADVDDFKRFNDTWGHAAGDAILRELGSLLFRQIRGEDMACRYGGDEFILILPDASRDVTRERAELICEHARQFHIQFDGQSLAAITLSLGIAVFSEHGATSTALLRTVDAALYRAKREGRDRVILADQNSHPGLR